MSELAVTVPQADHRRMRVVVAALVIVAAIVAAVALFWPAPHTSPSTHRFDIPQHLITEAQQERAAWAQVDHLIAEQQARHTCPVESPC